VPLVAGYGLRNWLLPLDDIFSDAEIEDWLDAAVEAGSYQGELLAAPVSTSTQLLFYNADLFEQAGITPPGNE
jgi:multiple sugar transport system substrate-binding protein